MESSLCCEAEESLVCNPATPEGGGTSEVVGKTVTNGGAGADGTAGGAKGDTPAVAPLAHGGREAAPAADG